MATAPEEKNYQVRWLRPEFQHCEEQLLSRAEIAEIGQVTPRSVTNWAKADDFPQAVKEVMTSHSPVRYWVAAEVFAWLRQRGTVAAERLRVMLAEYEIEQLRHRKALAHIDVLVDQIRSTLHQQDTISE